ncbi:MAG TPA: AI-2E family transporter [Stellaceae bacterium]|nr:AI-2E family transporter [Stellaceae bacterium]
MPASDAPEPLPVTPDEVAGARPSFAASGIGGALTLIVAAAVLYFARDIFVPLAIAALLSFVLSPPMLWLRHHGIGRAPAAAAVVLFAFVAILGFGSIVIGEVASLGKELPSYQTNIESKLHALRDAVPVDALFQRGTRLVQELRAELTPSPAALAPAGGARAASATGTEQAPVPVEIQQQTGVLIFLEEVLGPVLKPLATAGLVLVFVIFFLLNREDLRDRFIRLAGARDLHRATRMLNDAVDRLSRYLLMQFVVNTIYGTLIGVGAFAIGVPNAALWGALSLVLRFLPYIGTWFAALFPLGLALAVSPGWGMFVEMLGLFAVVELVTSNALEPWLFGASAGMSPVAVIVAATFWTWLWGPIGLVLSTPLTACLVVIGRYAQPLRFLAVLLGNESPLAAEESFYQRLLAGDAAEAAEQAEAFLKTGSLAGFCDQVAIPALLMAQEDSDRGVLTRDQRGEIADTIRETIESVGDDSQVDEPGDDKPVIECLGARNELDDAAAALLAQLLAERGLAARTTLARHWLTEPRLARNSPSATSTQRVLCLSHLGSAPPTRIRLLTRRLRRRSSAGANILLGLWSATSQYLNERGEAAEGVDGIETSLEQAVERIAAAVAPPAEAPPSADDAGALAASGSAA